MQLPRQIREQMHWSCRALSARYPEDEDKAEDVNGKRNGSDRNLSRRFAGGFAEASEPSGLRACALEPLSHISKLRRREADTQGGLVEVGPHGGLSWALHIPHIPRGPNSAMRLLPTLLHIGSRGRCSRGGVACPHGERARGALEWDGAGGWVRCRDSFRDTCQVRGGCEDGCGGCVHAAACSIWCMGCWVEALEMLELADLPLQKPGQHRSQGRVSSE